MFSRVRVAFVTLFVLAALAPVSSAAAQVVIGQTAPPGDTSDTCNYAGPYDELQVSVAAGPSYTIPTAGVLTSWSTNIGPTPGQAFGLKIFRPVAGSYMVVGQDQVRQLVSGSLNTFPVGIPVLTGDVIGLYLPTAGKTNCVFDTKRAADSIAFGDGNAAPGSTIVLSPESPESGARLNVSATLLPPPVITSITPAEGSVTGGAKVVIAGANFAGVSAVNFGATPATSFAVDSEGQITAVAPKSGKLVKAAISVTTIAGLAGAPTTFAYEGCKVPKLKDKKLKAVKKQAKKADCKIGKVKKLGDATAKTGEVVKQNPPPGKILAPGTKIKVTLDA